MKNETNFSREFREQIERDFPGSIFARLNPNHLQGIPDLVLFYQNIYLVFEMKRSKNASVRPNQEYYVDMFDQMSYARFVYPENREEVLDEVYAILSSRK